MNPTPHGKAAVTTPLITEKMLKGQKDGITITKPGHPVIGNI
jgi:hypothetical protein